MSCSKTAHFAHGDLLLKGGTLATVLGFSCDGRVYVRIGGNVKTVEPEGWAIVGQDQNPGKEIECLTCYTIREWVFYFARFWFPPIVMGLAFGYTGLALFGG